MKIIALPGMQQGATMLVALTVVMIVSLLATSVSHDFLNLSRRVDNQIQAQQVDAWLQAAEAVGRQVLLEDARLGGDIDYSLELWAQRLELELPIGKLSACMRDLQGRINLNSLASPADDGLSTDQRRFVRLLQVLELESPLTQLEAMALANAVFDWVDPDSDQRFPGGAEDLFYYQQDPAGKAANQPFASVSELRLVRGMTAEMYAALTPHVTLWGNGLLNINSADSHLTRGKIQSVLVRDELSPPVVLRTLNAAIEPGPLSEEAAWQLVNRRIENAGFDSVDALDTGMLAAVGIEHDGLATSSEYFMLVSEFVVADRYYQMQSVLHRQTDVLGIPGVEVLSRHRLNNRLNMNSYCVN